MRIDLGGPALEFVALGDQTYAAEIDGRRVPIRMHGVSEKVGWGATERHEERTEGMSVRCYELAKVAHATPSRDGDAVVLAYRHDQHYNAFDDVTVTIAFRDGVVVLDIAVTWQDDSYY